MKTLAYKIRNKFWTHFYQKGYDYHQVLTRAYIADMILSNIATAVATAVIIYSIVK